MCSEDCASTLARAFRFWILWHSFVDFKANNDFVVTYPVWIVHHAVLHHAVLLVLRDKAAIWWYILSITRLLRVLKLVKSAEDSHLSPFLFSEFADKFIERDTLLSQLDMHLHHFIKSLLLILLLLFQLYEAMLCGIELGR